MSFKTKKRVLEVSKHLIILLLLFVTFYPLVVMVFKSFKNVEQKMYEPFNLSFPLHLENYGVA